MTNEPTLNESEEIALQTLFGRQIPPVPDDGFSSNVVGRLRRRIWKRRVVLLSATVIGLVVALPMASELLALIGNQLVMLAGRAEQSEALGQFQVFLSMLPLREATQAAGHELRMLSTQVNSVSWIEQNMTLLFAGLLAAVSFVATRLLDE